MEKGKEKGGKNLAHCKKIVKSSLFRAKRCILPTVETAIL